MLESSVSLAPFTLNDATGSAWAFPTEGTTLLCFVKEDCPTCDTIMPLLEWIHQSSGDNLTVMAAGQTTDGNALLRERHALTVPLLDDSSLKVSFTYVIDIVPTLILADSSGRELGRMEGFVKNDWQLLVDGLALAEPVDWQTYPDWRPGCVSLSADPVIAARLQAQVENSPLRARRIDVAEQDDVFEFMLLGSGRLILHPATEKRAIVLDNILFVGSKERKLTKMLGSIKVQIGGGSSGEN